jgi:hypothetical protein
VTLVISSDISFPSVNASWENNSSRRNHHGSGFSATTPETLLSVAIALRSSEVERLDWAKVNKIKLAPWPSNCLKHSAISYAMARGDAGKISTWAGNSPAMIRQHDDAQAMPKPLP